MPIPKLVDPCGNPIPLTFDPSAFIPSIPSFPDILKMLTDLLGFSLPALEFPTPCPFVQDLLP